MRHKAKRLEIAWKSENRVLASKLEFHIKKSLTKSQKESLIRNPDQLAIFLQGKVDCEAYDVVNLEEFKSKNGGAEE